MAGHKSQKKTNRRTATVWTHPPLQLGPVSLHLFADVVMDIAGQGSVSRYPA